MSTNAEYEDPIADALAQDLEDLADEAERTGMSDRDLLGRFLDRFEAALEEDVDERQEAQDRAAEMFRDGRLTFVDPEDRT